MQKHLILSVVIFTELRIALQVIGEILLVLKSDAFLICLTLGFEWTVPLPPAEHRPFYYYSKLFVQDNLTKVTFELAEISSILVWVRLPQLNSAPESCHKTTDPKISILCCLAACIHLKYTVLLKTRSLFLLHDELLQILECVKSLRKLLP